MTLLATVCLHCNGVINASELRAGRHKRGRCKARLATWRRELHTACHALDRAAHKGASDAEMALLADAVRRLL